MPRECCHTLPNVSPRIRFGVVPRRRPAKIRKLRCLMLVETSSHCDRTQSDCLWSAAQSWSNPAQTRPTPPESWRPTSNGIERLYPKSAEPGQSRPSQPTCLPDPAQIWPSLPCIVETSPTIVEPSPRDQPKWAETTQTRPNRETTFGRDHPDSGQVSTMPMQSTASLAHGAARAHALA